MNDQFESDYQWSLDDFHAARRRAALDDVLHRISGKSSRMLQYDEVRKRLGGLESANHKLREIPLDAIVGTVGRYNDFNRKLLPLNKTDAERWVRVRRAVENQIGLPPIEVYQIGEVYFILDGHHRASVAREFGATHIQAYVREVVTRVPITPKDQLEDIILKQEYTEFLKQTRFDELMPGEHLEVSTPGSYAKLLEHISVHRYFMGIDQKRPVSYEEAVVHWFENVYCPVARIIRQRNVLRDFPGRTEADLYLWIMDHRSAIESEVGWKVSSEKAVANLISQASPTLEKLFMRIISRIYNQITPDALEFQPPPGTWRKQKTSDNQTEGLFDTVLVAVTGDQEGWPAVRQAAAIAKNERAELIGIHIALQKETNESSKSSAEIEKEFVQSCRDFGVESQFIIEQGNITRTILERSYWSDLLVLRLSHPPPFLSLHRISSGLRNLIRLVRIPIMVVPPSAGTGFERILLAYGGGKKADEALFIGAYLCARWNSELTVVTVKRKGSDQRTLTDKARQYLESHQLSKVTYDEFQEGSPAEAILKVSEQNQSSLILMGGYEGGYFRELIFGSTVDRVLQRTRCSVMICH